MKVFKSEKVKNKILCTYDQILEMWNVNKEEKDIITIYGTTHVIMCGNKNNPPLILFHGVGDNSAIMWIYNAAVLSRHFRLYAIDTIGGPGKSCPNKNYNKDFDDIKMD
jgi:pimeloyl-ACP methyl ester carboxylesterase